MQEPIRTLRFEADARGVRPPTPQSAGVQGEHNATRVIFALDEALLRPDYVYRFEYIDGKGGLDLGGTAAPEGRELACLLPEPWTRAGGCGTLRLCAALPGTDGQEEQVAYTLPALLTFAPRESAGPLEDEVKTSLSALMTDAAGAAEDAAQAAADARQQTGEAQAAADQARQAAATAETRAEEARTATATANAAAGGARAAKEAAEAAASGADASAEQARTAAASANTAAQTANTAASNAGAVADAVRAKLDAGELKGEKGDTGPQGPQGLSGVYVGGGEPPAGYTVQVDPTGDMVCFTADESDDRYGGVLTGAASGPVAALEDVSPTGALRRAAVLGATKETGEGDKGPDNPYTITGAEPAKLTVCGRNLLDLSGFTLRAEGSASYRDGTIVVTGANSWAGTALIFDAVFPPAAYCITKNGFKNLICDSDEIPEATYNGTYNGYGRPYYSNSKAETLRFTATKPFRVGFTCEPGDSVVYPQIELDDTPTPYAPYTGQTLPLPALEPLYGDGAVNDEYDAASGVEIRRWKQVVLDGTEKWETEKSTAAYTEFVSYGLLRGIADKGACVCTHYGVDTAPERIAVIAKSGHTYIRDASQTTVETFKAYLAAQYAAGTPVTVLYRLAEPVVTRHDPARIIPPAPVCRVFADAGTVDVEYNRDVNIVIPKLEAALAELLGGA